MIHFVSALGSLIVPNINGREHHNDLCNVSSFMMYLKSGTRTSSQEEFSERNLVQSLHSGYYICTEYDWGDNIEAVVDTNSSCINTTKMNFVLKDLDQNHTVITKRTERIHPYFMFANTTPNKRSIGAYGSEMSNLPDGVMKSDPLFSGGYVDQDFHYGSCRSYGHWIKSIVVPYVNPYTKRPIDTGIYQIQLEDLDVCDFHNDGNVVNTNPFELKIYQNHTLIHSYTSGRSFTYTLV